MRSLDYPIEACYWAILIPLYNVEDACNLGSKMLVPSHWKNLGLVGLFIYVFYHPQTDEPNFSKRNEYIYIHPLYATYRLKGQWISQR
jgi:hypothetical protein